ncbi:type IV toxin-antitoxin system AbiEi family antitoxin [Xenorhabdus bovienii]|uniref:type IV toxin-antitoxin system AbiEi family antitoxin n=1 Tax=Xenorhabdus bovienii TaxID=40576 RepID=UPI0023B345F8|nr:type IV toxin-antitoxin system AbiEi family antitoxin [Xenorhabdus bovienii]MDE9519736.1 type IV toxin-antitoxin system AbiEi family antitoxin [Xenorhabdus bovienii]
MPSKLNWLLQNTAPGSLVLQSWLTKHGISPSLANKYMHSNWLQKLRTGVYVRAGRDPEWWDVVLCLQNQLGFPVHLAGLTSLAYQGRSHYLQFKQQAIWLYVQDKAALPKWFKELPNIEWILLSNQKLAKHDEKYLTEVEIKGEQLRTSVPELAAYEIANAVPGILSFEHAAELFQGLVNLSPRKVEALLQSSRAVQTNRLYLFLADYYAHAWAKRLDQTNIDLGAGKRQIVSGGKLDRKYQITVPEKFVSHGLLHG